MAGKRTDSAYRVIKASPDAIYRAFLEPRSLLAWLPPEGMRGRILALEPRVGGTLRIALDYLSLDHTTPGKSGPHTDLVDARFVDLVPGRRVVLSVAFQSKDPAFAEPMTMTWSLESAQDGARVTVICQNVPEAIRKEDHDEGLRSSLANLARLMETPAPSA